MAWRRFCSICDVFYDSHKAAIKRMRELLDEAEQYLDSYGNKDAEMSEKMLRRYEELVGDAYEIATRIWSHAEDNKKLVVYGSSSQGGKV